MRPARVVLALVMLPVLFRGNLLSVYELVTDRFGPAAGRSTAGLFLATRSLSDGFRLFATGLVLAAALSLTPLGGRLGSLLAPALEPGTALLVVSIGLIALITLAYTLLGGMLAVIWTDVIQLAVYVAGACAAGAILLGEIPGGWSEVARARRRRRQAATVRLRAGPFPQLYVLVGLRRRGVHHRGHARRRPDVRPALPVQPFPG